MYEGAFEAISEKASVNPELNLFDVRLNNAISTTITLDPNFRHAKTECNRDAYALMLRLSNIWFCYEALLHACDTENLLENTKSKMDAISSHLLHELDMEYDLFEVRLEFWGMNGNIVHNPKYRADMQRYADHLITGATSKEQKKFLADVYNRFTNNDQFSIQEALAFAYAVRNQYVHAGESPESGVKYIETKIAALKASYDFLVLFCLRLGELLIDKKLANLAAAAILTDHTAEALP